MKTAVRLSQRALGVYKQCNNDDETLAFFFAPSKKFFSLDKSLLKTWLNESKDS